MFDSESNEFERPAPEFSIGEEVYRLEDGFTKPKVSIIDREYWLPDLYISLQHGKCFTMGWMYMCYPLIDPDYPWTREQDLRRIPPDDEPSLETETENEKDLVIVR